MPSTPLNRRSFLEFLGKGVVATAILPPFLQSCQSKAPTLAKPLFTGIGPIASDELVLSEGLSYQVLLRWEDALAEGIQFGFNNDFTAFLPLDPSNPDDGLLWVNHESVDAKFVSNYIGETEKNLEQVEREMENVGGSIVRVRKNAQGQWEVVPNDPLNRRITGHTPIPFNWDQPIAGAKEAMGTLANCSGGVTPWGTILTCEENYDTFYGERDFQTGERLTEEADERWYEHFDNPPEHYGWVVEVDPKTGAAQKQVALGRCSHECATVFSLPDERVVVYTGDDSEDECLYKFVSSQPRSLKEGTLYVANLEAERWESLDYASRPELQEVFADQTEVLVRLREASKLVGGTPLDRPEDIEIDPVTGHVLISLTNNKPKGNYYGSILKLAETNNDYESLSFTADTYLAGGEETGFACPDNMAFDPEGNLWFTSDISGSAMNKEPYTAFKNNGLFMVPRAGKRAGEVIQMASAPFDAELTGPWFAPDGKTLFLSVQHPGEESPSLEELSSHWPDGGEAIPRPAVVAIRLG
jgi:secreted PhoX family phosphatase